MALEHLTALISVKGLGHTANGMLTTGETLKASVAAAGSLPGRYRGVWTPFFNNHTDLENRATRRKRRIKQNSKVKKAAGQVRVGLRLVGDTVHNATVSLVPEEAEAAKRILPMVPKTYDLVKDTRENWIGQVQVLTNVLREDHKADLKTIGAWKKLVALEKAVREYVRIYGALPYRQLVPEDENLAKPLQNCVQSLRMAILQLVVAAFENPEHLEQIERMLQPYLNLVAQKQARGQRKSEDSGDTSTNDRSEKDQEDAEAPSADRPEAKAS